MSNYITSELRSLIANRVNHHCEYCLIHKDDTFFGCEVDHIISLNAYLDSATLIEDPINWTQCDDRIERAIRLAALLGQKAGLITKVVEHIKQVLLKHMN